jgi:hypothetical protein
MFHFGGGMANPSEFFAMSSLTCLAFPVKKKLRTPIGTR